MEAAARAGQPTAASPHIANGIDTIAMASGSAARTPNNCVSSTRPSSSAPPTPKAADAGFLAHAPARDSQRLRAVARAEVARQDGERKAVEPPKRLHVRFLSVTRMVRFLCEREEHHVEQMGEREEPVDTRRHAGIISVTEIKVKITQRARPSRQIADSPATRSAPSGDAATARTGPILPSSSRSDATARSGFAGSKRTRST